PWAAAAAATLRRPGLRPLGLRLASGTVLGSIGFASARYADGRHGSAADAARFAAPVACLLLVAVTFHVLLALPDGALRSNARRTSAIIGYAVALAIGIALGAQSNQVTVAGGVIAWSVAIALALPASHRTYLASA